MISNNPPKHTILIVANESPARAALLRYLTLSSYQTIIAETPEEAMQHMALPPDLILLDMLISGQDGVLVLRDLNEKNANVRILLMTEKADIAKAQAALNYGARDYLMKPIDLPTLKRVLQVHLTH